MDTPELDQTERPIFEKDFVLGHDTRYIIQFYKHGFIIDRYEVKNGDEPWIDGVEVDYRELIEFLDR